MVILLFSVIGASLVIVDTTMGLERINHCIAISSSHVWIRPKGLLFKTLSVHYHREILAVEDATVYVYTRLRIGKHNYNYSIQEF